MSLFYKTSGNSEFKSAIDLTAAKQTYLYWQTEVAFPKNKPAKFLEATFLRCLKTNWEKIKMSIAFM